MEGEEIVVAVGAVIEDQKGRILLVRHRSEREGFWKGKWICPGGRLNLGEAISEGIKREVLEETGLEITLKKPLPPFERIVKEGEKTTLHVIYIDYMARLDQGVLSPASDVGEALWADLETIKNLWEHLHEDTQRLLFRTGLIKEDKGGIIYEKNNL